MSIIIQEREKESTISNDDDDDVHRSDDGVMLIWQRILQVVDPFLSHWHHVPQDEFEAVPVLSAKKTVLPVHPMMIQRNIYLTGGIDRKDSQPLVLLLLLFFLEWVERRSHSTLLFLILYCQIEREREEGEASKELLGAIPSRVPVNWKFRSPHLLLSSHLSSWSLLCFLTQEYPSSLWFPPLSTLSSSVSPLMIQLY